MNDVEFFQLIDESMERQASVVLYDGTSIPIEPDYRHSREVQDSGLYVGLFQIKTGYCTACRWTDVQEFQEVDNCEWCTKMVHTTEENYFWHMIGGQCCTWDSTLDPTRFNDLDYIGKLSCPA